MKQATTISLSGIFFYIDTDAFKKLTEYLVSLQLAFERSGEKQEIMKEIEARIAEYFQSCRASDENVISREDVGNIIGILGQPRHFVDDDYDNHQEPSDDYYFKRKLFRNPDDYFLGGVASGIANYFSIDVVIIRLAWVFLIFLSVGSVLLAYVICWIVIPKAKTTVDKMRMRGEPINVDSIQKAIKEEVEAIAKKMKKVSYKETINSMKQKKKSFKTWFMNKSRAG